MMATKTRKDLDEAANSKEICLGRSLKLACRRNERLMRLAQMMRPEASMAVLPWAAMKVIGSVVDSFHLGWNLP